MRRKKKKLSSDVVVNRRSSVPRCVFCAEEIFRGVGFQISAPHIVGLRCPHACFALHVEFHVGNRAWIISGYLSERRICEIPQFLSRSSGVRARARYIKRVSGKSLRIASSWAVLIELVVSIDAMEGVRCCCNSRSSTERGTRRARALLRQQTSLLFVYFLRALYVLLNCWYYSLTSVL